MSAPGWGRCGSPPEPATTASTPGSWSASNRCSPHRRICNPTSSPRTTTSSISTSSAPCLWRSTSVTTIRNTSYADGQWELPANPQHYKQLSEAKKYADEGYSWQTRLWVDDMFMITDLQAQAYLVTGDKKYIDRAAREMALYLDRIQRPNGLFYHHTGTPFFWGRGDGWMAVGMAEMLRMLPKDNPYLPRIRAAYMQMMETLLRYQGYDGMWRQIIDNPNSWKETSSTAMFTYAMILGVKNGWLDKKIYGTAARKAWITLLSYLDEKDNLRNVCEDTGAKNSFDWYQNRRRLTGDLHGQAAMLWCAYALSCDVKPYKLTPKR